MPYSESSYVQAQEQLTNAIEAVRAETVAKVESFLQSNGLMYVVALIGDSETSGAIGMRNTGIITEFMENLSSRQQYAIQTGGTSGGVPELGTKIARQFGMATIGVYPAAVRNYALPEPADLVIETPDLVFGRTSFGTETPTFVNMLSGAVLLGGSFGTRAEVSSILRTNKSRQATLRRDPNTSERPIYLCPVAGTGRSADELVRLSIDEDIGECLPAPRNSVTTGLEAATFINNKLPPIY